VNKRQKSLFFSREEEEKEKEKEIAVVFKLKK
jgi:hypothetical protein